MVADMCTGGVIGLHQEEGFIIMFPAIGIKRHADITGGAVIGIINTRFLTAKIFATKQNKHEKNSY